MKPAYFLHKPMMIILSVLCIFLMSVWEMRAQPSRAAEKVIQYTRKEVLLQLADSLRRKSAEEKERALKKAAEKGWQPRIELGDGRVAELIRLDAQGNPVYYLADNAIAAITTNTSAVHVGGSLGYSLEGQGMYGGIWDAGAVRYTHEQLEGRVFLMDGAPFFDSHSTHVAGTMIADGTPLPQAKGMAPQATLRSYDWNLDNSEMALAGANGMLVSNHSYGIIAGWFNDGNWHWYGNPAISPDESYLLGWYDTEAHIWDNIAYNAPYYLIIKSAGNDRDDNPPPPGTAHTHFGAGSFTDYHPQDGNGGTGYDCLPTKSNAKNILTVGAVGDIPGGYSSPSDVVMSSFSGWGPTDDGRIKPDICGNGIGLFSCTAGSNSQYASYSGTSMASPNIAGSCLLLQQQYLQVHGTYMLASTLKGLIIHTADEAGNWEGPDYAFGWGLMNTGRAAALIAKDSLLQSHIQENVLHNGSVFTHNVISSGTEPLIATLCWTDVPATPESPGVDITTLKLVNDLDIRITHDDSVFFPYILDPANPTAAAGRGDNFRDNVEKIYIPNPDAGPYSVTITHKGNLTGGSQSFSLIISGMQSSPCSDPHHLAFRQQNGSSGIVSWSKGNTSTSWLLEYGLAGFSPGNGIILSGNYPGPSEVMLTGLQTGISYEAYLTEHCDSGRISNRIGPYRFTLVQVYSGSYCEDFDDFNTCGNQLFECLQNGACRGAFTVPGWENAFTDQIDWSVGDGPTPSLNTGPQTDHTTGNGKYLFTEASLCFNNQAILLTPAFDLGSLPSPSLDFWYHMLGSTMGNLQVDIEYPLGSGNWITLWTLSGNQGQNWKNTHLPLSAYGGSIVRFRFVAHTGPNYESDIALDDVCVSSSCAQASDCEDNNPCTDDYCNNGLCAHTPLCPDGNSCTIDVCINGICYHDTIAQCTSCTNMLSTSFNGNTGQHGNMFDITAVRTIKILSFDGHFSTPADVEIYYKPGSHRGYENTSQAWNRIGSASQVASAGAGQPSPIPIPVNLTIPAGETYAFYITTTGNQYLRFRLGTTWGTPYVQDSNLLVKEGTAIDYPFGTYSDPWQWNGVIHYICEDYNPCSVNQCTNGVCSYVETSCPDDNDPCTVNLGCINGQCVIVPLDCNDNNPCTEDACDPVLLCTHSPIAGCNACTSITCDDNNACTADYCDSLTGCFYISLVCSDSNPCTIDSCLPVLGCFFPLQNCNDGNFCTEDYCENGKCQHSPVNCDDNNPCTIDTCDFYLGCLHLPVDCDDGNLCTVDSCVTGTCIHLPLNCNDNNLCTTDSCSTTSGCIYSPLVCNDNDPCTNDTCIEGMCIYTYCSDNNPCTLDTCINGECVFSPIICNDFDPCTLDSCVNGICMFTSVDCDDQDACTQDNCINGICIHTPLFCDDGDNCTQDFCQGGQCLHSCSNMSYLHWQRTLGGSSNDQINSIRPTPDEGFIAAGFTLSADGDITGHHGAEDFWIIRLDANGDVVWQKVYGGSSTDIANAIRPTKDNGYIVAGYTTSTNGDITGNHGSQDFWIVKLDAAGNLLWSKTLGGTGADAAYAITQTSDDGYIVAGYTASSNGDVTGYHGGRDFWVVKLDNTGNIIWQRALGGSNLDDARDVLQTLDGNYVVAGYTLSSDGDVSVNKGVFDYWVVKLDTSGNIIWLRTFGGSSSDKATAVEQTSDGGYLVAGSTASFNGDVSGNHGLLDFWVIKLDSAGLLQWQKTFGGSANDEALAVVAHIDNTITVAGYSASSNGNVAANNGGDDFWIIRLTSAGNMVWSKNLGGSSADRAHSLCITAQGYVALAGYSASANGDLSINKGGNDAWITHLALCSPTVTVDSTVCTPPPAEVVLDTFIRANGCDSIVAIRFIYQPCNDSLACTIDTCIQNHCVYTFTIADCDDQNCLTIDRFDTLTCACVHDTLPAPDCNDFNCFTRDVFDSLNCMCIYDTVPGGLCNDNNPCTSDTCIQGTCIFQHTAAVTVEEIQPDYFCQDSLLKLIAYASNPVSFQWSTGDTVNFISASAMTTYGLTTTDGNNCTHTTAFQTSPPYALLSHYVMLARQKIELFNNIIFEGGAGVTDSSGVIHLHSGSIATAPSVFVAANAILDSGGSQIARPVYAPAQAVFPPFDSTAFRSGTGVRVTDHTSIILSDTVYNFISVGKNCTVEFTAPRLYVKNLIVNENAVVRFAGCTRLFIETYMVLNNEVLFNPDTNEVVVFIGTHASVGRGVRLFADLYAPEGSITTSKSEFSNPTIMYGMFIADKIRALDHTHWYVNPFCDALCPENVASHFLLPDGSSIRLQH
ncbi:MAG: hypothetical protein KatS3mg031_1685 [Chitinophagales bacterium]|nr:MAG: hypothetical protein KatS3mg031_1685 [Chitinophagales bacterium]